MPVKNNRPGAATGKHRIWHPYATDEDKNEDEVPVVLRELQSVVRARSAGKDPTQAEIQSRVAELKTLIRSAELGELSDDNWKHIVRDPQLWELRLSWNQSPKALVRAYFIEPPTHPGSTVLIIVHEKDVSSREHDQINAAQDVFIDEASSRLELGRSDSWGLGWTSPIFPRASR